MATELHSWGLTLGPRGTGEVRAGLSEGRGRSCAPESAPDWRTGPVSSGRAKGTQISLKLQRGKGRKGKETARTNTFLEGEKPGKVNSDTHTKKENTNPCFPHPCPFLNLHSSNCNCQENFRALPNPGSCTKVSSPSAKKFPY